VEILRITPPVAPELARPPLRDLLRAWPVGQILEATVLEVPTPARAILMMAGQRVEAQTGVPLEPGQRLTVRVETQQLPVVLRVIGPPGPTADPIEVQRQAVREVLPNAIPLARALGALAQLSAATTPAAQSEGNPPLPAAFLAGVRALLGTLPDRAQVATGPGLRAALADTGAFLEARLAALSPGDPAPRADLKAALLTLTELLPRAARAPKALAVSSPATATGQATPSTAAAAGDPPAPPAQRAPQSPAGPAPAAPPGAEGGGEAMTRAAAHVDGALARIELSQLRSLPQPDGSHPGWLVEVPVRSAPGQVDVLTVHIEPDEAPAGRGVARRGWAVSLSLDLEALGPIRARVGWQDGAVSATFWAERPATVEMLGRHSAELVEALHQAGLKIAAVQCHEGPGPEMRGSPLPDRLLDLSA